MLKSFFKLHICRKKFQHNHHTVWMHSTSVVQLIFFSQHQQQYSLVHNIIYLKPHTKKYRRIHVKIIHRGAIISSTIATLFSSVVLYLIGFSGSLGSVMFSMFLLQCPNTDCVENLKSNFYVHETKDRWLYCLGCMCEQVFLGVRNNSPSGL